jgi:hypothetical protein
VRVRCQAVRSFAEPQPGVIEAYLTDSDGFRWQIVEKTVVFHEWRLFGVEPPSLPMPVSVECRIVADHGGHAVSIVLPGVRDRVYEVATRHIDPS